MPLIAEDEEQAEENSELNETVDEDASATDELHGREVCGQHPGLPSTRTQELEQLTSTHGYTRKRTTDAAEPH